MATIKSTDFIKIKGLQSTPGEGASLEYWEVFEGIGGDGSAGASSVISLPTPSPNLPTTPEEPGSSWLDLITRTFSLIGSLTGSAVDILKSNALMEIIDSILVLVAKGAGVAALAAGVYLITKLMAQFLTDFLDEKTGFEPDLLTEIRTIRDHLACLCVSSQYWTQYDNDKAPTNAAESLHDIKQHLFELRKYWQTGKGDEALGSELGGLIQAVKDNQYNEEEYHLPGTEIGVKRRGIVRKK